MGACIGGFIKYIYWLDEDSFLELEDALTRRGTKPKKAAKAVCLPLSKRFAIGFVPPEAWEQFTLCKRQLSWHKTSRQFGRTLVVSAFPLDFFGIHPETIITETKFRPPELPGRKEQLRLISRQSYQTSKPPEWEKIDSEPPGSYEKWMKIMGVRGISYEELFVTHCANHANFIEPAYFTVENDAPVPYSISRTSHVCSACLEFFNIIGYETMKKRVVPCPGAVLFAGMAPNRYYEVVQPGETTHEEGPR